MRRDISSRIVSLLAGVAWIFQLINAQDPCTTFVHIGSERRSVLYEYNPLYEDPICDYDINENSWHSFEARTGGIIPEVDRVEIRHCGTFGPIYIPRRPEPQVSYHKEARTNPTLTAQAPTCENHGGPTACDTSKNITIRYCPPVGANEEFFVYKLKQPYGCSLGYCAGEQPSCRDGLMWNNATGKCESLVPIMGFPELTGPVVQERNVTICFDEKTIQRFVFVCKIGYQQQQQDDKARFIVKVVFDDVVNHIIEFPIATGMNPSVEIGEEVLRGHLGKRIACEVTSFWELENATERSEPKISRNSYWAGIKAPTVVVDRTTLQATKKMSAPIWSTVPITCWHCATLDSPTACECCKLNCQYIYSITAKVNSDKCSVTLNNINMIPNNEFVAGTVTFDLHQDALLAPTNTFQISFNRYRHQLIECQRHELWLDYLINPMTVNLINPPKPETLRCESYGDPRITTIRKSVPPFVQLLGDFLVARVIDPGLKYYMLIQERHFACGTNLGCNCAVIVREGNSVLGIDMCNNNGGTNSIANLKIIRYLRTISPDGTVLSDGADVFKGASDTQYTILMASGLRLDVQVDVYRLNYWVTFPDIYNMDNIDGLCDWLPPYSNGEEFRLSNADSLFHQNPPTCYNWGFEPAFQCQCQTSDIVCTSKGPSGSSPVNTIFLSGFYCVYDDSKKTDGLEYTIAAYVTDDEKSDDILDLGDIYYTFPYDEEHGKNVSETWPTPSGKTEEEVEQYCISTLQRSAVYDKCQGKYEGNIIMHNCKSDVQLTDDYSWADSYLNIMEKNCLDSVIIETNSTSSDELESNPIFTEVVKDICPAQCHNRGACLNSICICTEEYVGPDCGVSKNLPPTLILIQHNGMCNLTHRECAKVQVYASNIYESGFITCRFTSSPLIINKDKNSEVLFSPGKLVTFEQIECPIPSTKIGSSSGYQLAISNDGVLYSNEMPLIVFDPTCLVQTGDTWQQKVNTCFFNELCYVNGQRQNDTNCLVCTPNGQTNVWTNSAAWGPWSNCSRSCDTGVEYRDFGCQGVVFTTNVRLCLVSTCPGKPEEKPEGVILGLRTENVMQALLKSDLLFESVAAEVNKYCDSNLAECCSSFKPLFTDNNRKLLQGGITTKDQVYYASGYPYQFVFDLYRMKLIVVTTELGVADLCESQSTQRNVTNNILFVDPMILFNSVTASKVIIEEAVGIIIDIIELPDPEK